MKKGTFVALDKNYKNVLVGDFVRDNEGFIYQVDNFGNAVKKADNSLHDLKKLEGMEYYPVEDEKEPVKDDTPATEQKTEGAGTKMDENAIKATKKPGRKMREKQQRKPRQRKNANAAKAEPAGKDNPLKAFTDQALADELRARGYRLTAKKTVSIKL